MLESERDDTADNLSNTQTHIPEGKPGCLFTARIILATQQHQGWTHGRLEDTEENSCDQQTAVVGGAGRGSRSDAPEKDVTSEPFGRGGFLEAVDYREESEYGDCCGW